MKDTLQKKNEDIIKKNTEITCNKIEKFFHSIPKEFDYMRAEAAEHLIIESMLWGTYSYYEALGILEAAKIRYNELYHETALGPKEESTDNVSG